ncbi:MAG: polyprenyl synthetase family protein [Bacteroidia bacterium]
MNSSESLFDAHLANYLNSVSGKNPVELYEPESYILSLGGKRVRPNLVLKACQLFDVDISQAMDAALCVEIFHNFSLIHDDILDNAPLRRNKPTVHEKWNTNIAILSGDVMLVKAFDVLKSYDGEKFKQLYEVFSKTAIDVCEGQQYDMNFEKLDNVSVEDYINMITNKTAVLLGCSLQMGAIVAGTSIENQIHLYEFGKNIGIAFQLLDDYLDAFPIDSTAFGKQIGGDIISNKKTYLLLKALEMASESQKNAIHLILKEQNPEQKVNDMLQIYKVLNLSEACKAEANRHTTIALDHLLKIKAKPEAINELREFASSLLNRTH